MSVRSSRLLARLDEFTAFVRRRVGDHELAADVVQDALAKALAAADDLRDDGRLEAWFYRILRTTIADALERIATARRRAAGDAGEPVAEAEERAVVCACLDAAISALKPEHAEVLRRVDLGGEDAEAVAGALAISAGNLKVRRHRAREALRARLIAACRTCGTHGCRDCDCGH
jgi:RNA polymerase sigma-70 factor (ECF subfamily)